ncbi:hypothetical protein CLV92_105289 [Kineococcus xinjiangensis]|uniref:Uncharacterized protein n=1 Tax=Kineococcus xinjiangensis TaxID=512762 RepID=A0A2S6IPK8_9ACTN|nr:hypothetical protein [Kineococcus xinjiangensis]PPK96187.1 hypothetical protein CLV92_105289 [Kineococcus xinjiangensis]
MSDLRALRARAVTEDLPPEEMPDWATRALVEGLDSPALAELAGMGTHDPRTVREVFHTAVDELGAPPLTMTEAMWEMTHHWAQAMLDGTLTPYDAAHRIWNAWHRLDHPDELIGFVGDISQWDDVPGSHSRIEQSLRAEASEYLRKRQHPASSA